MPLHQFRTSWVLLALAIPALGALGACLDTTSPLDGAVPISVGDTITGSIAPGGGPLVYTVTARSGTATAVFLHVTQGEVHLKILSDGAVATVMGDVARVGALEERVSRLLSPETLGRITIVAEAIGDDGARFRFKVWELVTAPEHRAEEIAIGSVISSEDLENHFDVDEFTFEGEAGQELIGYVRTLAPDPKAVVSMRILRDRREADHWALAVAMSDTVLAELEGQATGRFTLPATARYTVRVKSSATARGRGGIVGFRPSYELLLRPVDRGPEQVSSTLVAGDTLEAEAIDYVGDVDEFTISAPAGGDFNLFVQRTGTTGNGVVAEVLGATPLEDLGLAIARDPDAPLGAVPTGRFRVAAGATVQVRVYGSNEADDGFRGAYRLFLYEIDRTPEIANAAVALGGSIIDETIELPGDIDQFVLTVPQPTMANFVLWSEEDGTHNAASLALLLHQGAATGVAGGGSASLIRQADESGLQGSTSGTAQVAGAMEPVATGMFELRAGTHIVQIASEGSRLTSYRGRYEVYLYAIDTMPETGISELSYGARVDEAIEPPGDQDTFTFTGRRDHHVALSLEGGGEALSSFEVLVENVRTGQLVPSPWIAASQAPRFELPESGEYRIRVRPYGWGKQVNEQGPYRLALDTVSAAPEHHALVVAVGDSVTDERLDFMWDVDAFHLVGAPGQEVTLTFTAPVEDGPVVRLDLFDLESGERIDGTTSAGYLQSAGRFTLPANGKLGMHVYQAWTSPYQEGATGLYRVVVLPIDRRPESVPSAILVDSIIEGETIDPDADIDEFTLAAAAGDRIEAHFQTPNGAWRAGAALVLEVLDPSGAVLGSVSSINPTDQLEDQRTAEIVLATAGTYTVRIRSELDHAGGGVYRFRVKRLP